MIRIADEDGIRTVLLDRAPSNGLTVAMFRDLARAAREAAGDASVRCLVMSSAIPKYFSSGLDPQELALGADGAVRTEPFAAMFEAFRAWIECPKPTVASIEGYALLGGCIIALGCDFRILARETGRMSLSEIRLGLSPMPLFLSRLLSIGVSPAAARQLALKGRTLKADEAFAAGLADRVVPASELAAETRSEARSLARMPPAAYAAVKRHLAQVGGPDLEGLWRQTLAEFPALLAGPEAREAIAGLGGRKRAAAGEP